MRSAKWRSAIPHYSAQVIDPNGRAYYFDDIGCAILWMGRQPWKDKARTWVNDVKTKEWVDAERANWIYGDPKTPMGYGFAATLSPVENAMDYETVKKWMVIGKTLVNENLVKHLNKDPGKKNNNQIPWKVKSDGKTE